MNMKKYCRKDYGKQGKGGPLGWPASDSCYQVPGIHEISCPRIPVPSVSEKPQEPGFTQLPCTGHLDQWGPSRLELLSWILLALLQRAMWLQSTRLLSGLLCPHCYPGIVSCSVRLSSITVGRSCKMFTDSLGPRWFEESAL